MTCDWEFYMGASLSSLASRNFGVRGSRTFRKADIPAIPNICVALARSLYRKLAIADDSSRIASGLPVNRAGHERLGDPPIRVSNASLSAFAIVHQMTPTGSAHPLS